MRVSPFVSLALLLPALAAAQEAAGELTPAGGDEAGESYTVQQGDTLWDLSKRFLDDPYTWPKVWAENPAIANPHFIYPGNTVRFPGQRGAAAVGIPRELEDFSVSDGRALGDDDDVAVVGPYRIGYVAPRGLRTRRESFVTQQELDASGVLHAAFEERAMLSTLDTAYARFPASPTVKPGERYLLYKTERQLVHPITGAPLGYQITILGTGRVVAVDDRAATVQIAEALEPIERGALLMPAAGLALETDPAARQRPRARRSHRGGAGAHPRRAGPAPRGLRRPRAPGRRRGGQHLRGRPRGRPARARSRRSRSTTRASRWSGWARCWQWTSRRRSPPRWC